MKADLDIYLRTQNQSTKEAKKVLACIDKFKYKGTNWFEVVALRLILLATFHNVLSGYGFGNMKEKPLSSTDKIDRFDFQGLESPDIEMPETTTFAPATVERPAFPGYTNETLVN